MVNIASCISSNLFFVALAQAAREEVLGRPIEKLMVYLFDIVDPQAFPLLADQLDVLGFKGFIFADTDEAKRELFERAALINSRLGTPWAVKDGLKTDGYLDAEIIEGIGIFHNGRFIHDGTIDHGSGTGVWATFSVKLDLGENKGITDAETIRTRAIINTYKNARSTLIDLLYKATISDTLTYVEAEALVIEGNGLSDEQDYEEDLAVTVETPTFADTNTNADGGMGLKVYRFGIKIIDENI